MIQLYGKDIPGFLDQLFPADFIGHAAELGAADGLYLSNTLAFEQRGWTVLCIEPNQVYHDRLRANRKLMLPYACSYQNQDDGDLVIYERHLIWPKQTEPVAALGGLEAQFKEDHCDDAIESGVQHVPVRTLDHCLEEVKFPCLDFLSLDVDGIEAEILQGLDAKRWGLKAAIVENTLFDRCISEYFTDLGFNLVARTPVDDIWVKE